MRAPAPARRVEPFEGRGRQSPALVAPVTLVALAGLAITGFYLATYLAHRFPVPLGWDTPGYAWRTNFVRAFGVANLPASIPNPGPVNPGRPAFAVIAAVVGTIGRVDPFRVAAVLPATMAAAIGLAAGALLTTARRRTHHGHAGAPFELVAIAVGVGTSVFVVRLINVEGYQDATIAAAILVAGLTAALLAGSWSRRPPRPSPRPGSPWRSERSSSSRRGRARSAAEVGSRSYAVDRMGASTPWPPTGRGSGRSPLTPTCRPQRGLRTAHGSRSSGTGTATPTST